MKQLSYASKEAYKMGTHDITEILFQSRRNNKAHNITGLLLYLNGCFLQILEGENETIDTLYEIIKTDKRHQNVTLLHTEEIKNTVFAQWSMAYVSLEDLDRTDGNIKRLVKSMAKSTMPSEKIITMIIKFKDGTLEEFVV